MAQRPKPSGQGAKEEVPLLNDSTQVHDDPAPPLLGELKTGGWGRIKQNLYVTVMAALVTAAKRWEQASGHQQGDR